MALNDLEYTLNGYKSFNSLGTLNKSDGVTVFIKEFLSILQMENQVLLNCNSIFLKIKLNEKIVSLTCIYRSPNDNLEIFIKSLNSFLSHNNNKCPSIICGDINIDILGNSNINNEYQNILAANGFITCINNFTSH